VAGDLGTKNNIDEVLMLIGILSSGWFLFIFSTSHAFHYADKSMSN